MPDNFPRSAGTPAHTDSASLAARALFAGLVCFAAVTGLLLGVGRRSGTPWRPLNAAAHLVIGSRADGVWNFQADVTPLGCLVVLALSVMAGLVVACVTPSRRPTYIILSAAFVALAGYLVHMHVVVRTPGGLAGLLSLGELRAVYLTSGIALAVGIRLALLPPRGSRTQVLG